MSARFSGLIDRLHRVGSTRLSDAMGKFISSAGPVVENIKFLIDRNLQLEGAGDIFSTSAVGISWYRESLQNADRGDVFEIGAERFMVERVILDDGHMVTAACMVQP
jgi:hypothetical protein